MNQIKRCFLLSFGLAIAMLPLGSAFATQPGEGTAFDTLQRGCRQAFPHRNIDLTRPKTIVVEKSTFCVYVLQRDSSGIVVSTLATAASFGRDLSSKNGKYIVSEISWRSKLPNTGLPNRRQSPTRQSKDPLFSIDITLLSAEKVNCQCRLQSVVVQNVQDPLDVGGLIWNLPGVALRTSDASKLIRQINLGDSVYVVNRLSDIGL
jgi:hypothetical protein